MELGALSFDLFYPSFDESLVTETVETCVDRGCHTDRDGGTDRWYYIGPTSDYDPTWLDADEAVGRLAEDGGVTLLWYGDFDCNLHVDPQGREHEVPLCSFWLDEVFYRPSRSSESAVRDRVETLLDLVCGIAEQSEPVAGYGYIDEIVGREGGAYEGIAPAAIREGRPGVVHWFTLFPSGRVEELGRDRVLSAPAWRVRELPSGAVAVVASEQPLYGGGDQRQAIADHLGLDGPEDRQILDPEKRLASQTRGGDGAEDWG